MKLILSKAEAEKFVLENIAVSLESVEIVEGSVSTGHRCPSPENLAKVTEVVRAYRKGSRCERLPMVKEIRAITGFPLRDAIAFTDAIFDGMRD